MLSVVSADGTTPNDPPIDQIVREGARRMPAAALEAEVNVCIGELTDRRVEYGRRLVVPNGCHQPRQVTTVAGTIEVKAPRVSAKRVDEATGKRKRFASATLPPWCRKSPKISQVLPLLCLHGLSSGDLVSAFEQFLGSSAGLSTANVTRLTQQWQAHHEAFGERELTGSDDVYVQADGIHLRIRFVEAKSCILVVMGVRAYGAKELIAMTDGYRESTESRADNTAKVLNALPISAQSNARKVSQDIGNAEDHEHAVTAVAAFDRTHGAKWPKGAKRKVTEGAGSAAAALARVFRLTESAQAPWRAVNAPHLVALVRAGARSERGYLVERAEAVAA